MNRKKQNDLLSEYARIPNERAEDHLSGWREKQTTLKQTHKERHTFAFLRSPYFIGALVCILLVAIIVPIVLVYTKGASEGDQDPVKEYYCSEGETRSDPIVSVSAFNEKYHTNVRDVKREQYDDIMYFEDVFIATEEAVDCRMQISIWDDYYFDVTVCCFVGNYRYVSYGDRYSELEIDGVTVRYIDDLDGRPETLDYLLAFCDGQCEYVLTADCDQEVSIEDIYHRFF